MTKSIIAWIASAIFSTAFTMIALILAPILPMFATMRYGWSDNANAFECEPRLPEWLSWFDTSYDNSLWGDNGWRTEHCPKYWRGYIGMVLWLIRNPAAGLCWLPLARYEENRSYIVSSSGCGLTLNRSENQQGWFMIRSSSGAWQFRAIKRFLGIEWSLECGWLIDPFVKHSENFGTAKFLFSPNTSGIK